MRNYLPSYSVILALLFSVGSKAEDISSKAQAVGATIEFAQAFGGSAVETIRDIAIDPEGNILAVGSTDSPDFLGTGTDRDGFVMKLDPTGERVLWSVRFGGTGTDETAALAVDANGNVVIAGGTTSGDFPTTPDAFQTNLAGSSDAFILIFDPNGQRIFSSYYGGAVGSLGTPASPVKELIEDMAFGPDGVLYAGGIAASVDFPVTEGAIDAPSDFQAGMAMAINLNLDSEAAPAVLFATRLPAAGGPSLVLTLAVGDRGLYVGGSAVRPFRFNTDALGGALANGRNDGFVCRFDLEPDVAFDACVMLGGTSSDLVTDISQAPDGSVYVAGYMIRSELPAGTAMFDVGTGAPPSNGFVARFGPDLRTLPSIARMRSEGAAFTTVRPDGSVMAAYPAVFDHVVTDNAFSMRECCIGLVVVQFDGQLSEVAFAGFVTGQGGFPSDVVTASNGGVLIGGSPGILRDFPSTREGRSGTDQDAMLLQLALGGSGGALRREAIVGGADFRGSAIVANRITSIFLQGFGPSELAVFALDGDGRLPRELGGTRVLVNGEPSPVIFTVDGQLSFIPDFAGGGEVEVVVEHDGVRTNPIRMVSAESAPGIFTLSQTGAGQGAILNQDFSVNKSGNGAPSGTAIQVFLTGAGPYDIACPADSLAPTTAPLPRLALPVRAFFGLREVQVLYAGAAPGLLCAVAQVNVLVDGQTDPDDAELLRLRIGDGLSQEKVTFAAAP